MTWRSRSTVAACWLIRGLTIGLFAATVYWFSQGAFVASLLTLCGAVLAGTWADSLTAKQ